MRRQWLALGLVALAWVVSIAIWSRQAKASEPNGGQRLYCDSHISGGDFVEQFLRDYPDRRIVSVLPNFVEVKGALDAPKRTGLLRPGILGQCIVHEPVR